MAAPKKVALVTGGSRGIGLGIAKELATSGFDLVINGRRDASQVIEAIAEIRSLGTSALYIQADVADLGEHAKLLEAAQKECARLDLLVNNAGIAPPARADLLDATPESFDTVVQTNLRGPYFLTQAVARWMIEQRKANPDYRGCIVNISSVSATVASTNRGDYCISKAAISMATKLWAVRLAEFGIDVYEVRPGIIETDMTAGVKQKYDALIANGITVERRWGTPTDVGKAVAMLARGELRYATGQVLEIDGGLTLLRL